MKNLKNLLSLALVMVIIILSSSRSTAEKGCYKFNAKGQGEVTGVNNGVTITEADIIGGGLLNGSTRAEFTSPVSPDAFVGPLILTTKHGSIIFYINDGRFIEESGFIATAVAVASEGKLAGAQGYVILNGEITPTGSFTEKISGNICFN